MHCKSRHLACHQVSLLWAYQMEGVTLVKNSLVFFYFLFYSSIPGDISLLVMGQTVVLVRLYVEMQVSLFYGFNFSSKDE